MGRPLQLGAGSRHRRRDRTGSTAARRAATAGAHGTAERTGRFAPAFPATADAHGGHGAGWCRGTSDAARRRAFDTAGRDGVAVGAVQRAIQGDQRQLDDGSGPAGQRAIELVSSTPSRVLVATAAVGIAIIVAAWIGAAPAVVASGLSLLLLTAAAVVDARRAPAAQRARRRRGPAGRRRRRRCVGRRHAEPRQRRHRGAALVGAPLLATHLVSPAGMGFGDVKAGTVLGAAVGLVDRPCRRLDAAPGARRVRPVGRRATAPARRPRPGAGHRRGGRPRRRSAPSAWRRTDGRDR